MQGCIENICCANILATHLEQYNVTRITACNSFINICLDPEVLQVMLCFINDMIGESLQEQLQNRYINVLIFLI